MSEINSDNNKLYIVSNSTSHSSLTTPATDQESDSYSLVYPKIFYEIQNLQSDLARDHVWWAQQIAQSTMFKFTREIREWFNQLSKSYLNYREMEEWFNQLSEYYLNSFSVCSIIFKNPYTKSANIVLKLISGDNGRHQWIAGGKSLENH